MGYIIHIDNDINWKIKTKMKGSEWFTHLSELERGLFRINTQGNFDFCMESDYGTFASFIGGAFIWSNVPEGFEFWHNIWRRPIEVNTPTKYYIKKFKFV